MKTVSTCSVMVHMHLSDFVQFLDATFDAKMKIWPGVEWKHPKHYAKQAA